jgi:hypothetical protein
MYSIPCECGRSYTGERGRPVAVRLREHRHTATTENYDIDIDSSNYEHETNDAAK